MTREFDTDDRYTKFAAETFQVESLRYVDAEKLDDIEKASIERAVVQRERLLTELQTDFLHIQSERNALETRLSQLESERHDLRERVRELETQRPMLEPRTVFASLGTAFDEVDDDLADARYTVSDVDFTLKTNVVQTNEGLRMHLPSLDERSVTENLSEVSFRLRPKEKQAEPDRPEDDFREVPDLTGLTHEDAARRLAAARLAAGEVSTVDDPTERPGTVVGQFPDPYTIAPPESPVDLTVVVDRETAAPEEAAAEAEKPDEDTAVDAELSDSIEERDVDASVDEREVDERGVDERDIDEREADERDVDAREGDDSAADSFERAVEEPAPDVEAEIIRRLREAGVDDLEELVGRDPSALSELLDLPERYVTPFYERLVERSETEPATLTPLETIDGIGPTYARRLRDAGIEGVEPLARLDPKRVADAASAPSSRAEGWVEQARELVR